MRRIIGTAPSAPTATMQRPSSASCVTYGRGHPPGIILHPQILIPASIEPSEQETEAEPPARATGATPTTGPEQAPQGEGGQGEGQEVCAQSQTEAQECRQEHRHAQGSDGEQCDGSHHRVQAQSVGQQQVIHLTEQPRPGELPHDK